MALFSRVMCPTEEALHQDDPKGWFETGEKKLDCPIITCTAQYSTMDNVPFKGEAALVPLPSTFMLPQKKCVRSPLRGPGGVTGSGHVTGSEGPDGSML